MNRLPVLTIALLALVAAPVMAHEVDPEIEAKIEAARAKLDAAARELAELHTGDAFQWVARLGADRPFLGVLLGEPSGDGVKLVGVTPGSGAAKAGLEAGDVLTKVNGVAVEGKPRNVTKALHDVEVGADVEIEYRRGGKDKTATVTTQMRDAHAMLLPDFDVDIDMQDFDDIGGKGVRFQIEDAGLRLHDLDSDLASYFGVDNGVLVLSAGKSGLKSGDVIVAVAGAAPKDARDARHRIASADGAVDVTVRRQGVEQAVSVDGASLAVLPPGPHIRRVIHLRDADGNESVYGDED